MTDAFLSALGVDALRRTLRWLPHFLRGPANICSSPALLEHVLMALLCEYDEAPDDLEEYLAEPEQPQDDPCVVCTSRQLDALLMPCKHLIICCNCVERMAAAGLPWNCPYCRMPFDKVIPIEEVPDTDQQQDEPGDTHPPSAAHQALNWDMRSPSHGAN